MKQHLSHFILYPNFLPPCYHCFSLWTFIENIELMQFLSIYLKCNCFKQHYSCFKWYHFSNIF